MSFTFLQFGFQENHSIDHALVSLTEDVRNVYILICQKAFAENK